MPYPACHENCAIPPSCCFIHNDDGFLNLLHEFCHCEGARQGAGDVDMIVGAAYTIGLGTFRPADTCEICMQFCTEMFRYCLLPILGTKNDVKQHLGESLCHGRLLFLRTGELPRQIAPDERHFYHASEVFSGFLKP